MAAARSLRLGFLQFGGLLAQPDEAMAYVTPRIQQMAADGVQIVVLPELAITGYSLAKEQLSAMAEPAEGGSVMKAMCDLAKQYSIAICFGFPERESAAASADGDGEEAAIYNSAAFISRTGHLLSVYRKQHLYSDFERERFAPSSQRSVVFSYDLASGELLGSSADGSLVGSDPSLSSSSPSLEPAGEPVEEAKLAHYDQDIINNRDVSSSSSGSVVNIGLLICYDVEFPEPVRDVALLGAELVLVPTASFSDKLTSVTVPCRAMENHIVMAYINRCGLEGTHEFGGRSCVYGPDGEALAIAGRDAAEAVVDIDLNSASYRQWKEINPYFDDRRPEMYGGLTSSLASDTADCKLVSRRCA